jgi:tetratricopeptide (TPR) repeat protein
MSKKKIEVKGRPSFSFLQNKRSQIIVISLFVLCLYSKITSYQFIGLDEPTLIIDNYKFLRDPSNVSKAFTQHVFYAKHHTDNPKDYYRPILTLSFMLDAQFSARPEPKFFHLSNIIYHIIACILLFFLFHRLGIEPLTIFMLTLIFAAHPLLTQAIAWIPGRNDSLITIFCLLSFISLVKYIDTGSFKNVALHVLFFAVALLTKESAMALIAVTFFFIVFIRHKKLFSIKNIYILCGYLLVITCWYYMRRNALSGTVSQSMNEPFKELLQNSPLAFQYIQKIVLPFNLSVMSVVKDTNYILSVLALLILAAGIYFTKIKRWNYILFGLFWFLAFIAPSFLTGYFGGLEHRTYLSMVGIFIVVSQFDIFKSDAVKKYKYVGLGILLVFTGITLYRLPVFSNALLYYDNAVKTSENSSLACLNLGKTYESMGQYRKAIEVYREGLKRNPNERLLHNNIGGALIFLKMDDEAEIELKKEIELFPDSHLAYYNLGLVKKHAGKMDEAVSLWKKSKDHNKNFRNPYEQLAEYYKSVNDSVELKKCVDEMMKID